MTALVTGAGGSLGRAIAVRLASDGHPLAVVDIDEAASRATVALIEDAGGQAVAVAADLRHDEQIAGAFATATHTFGPVSVLVNNAAVFPSGPFVDITAETHDDTIRVNQRAYFVASQHAARAMIEHGGGSIVNVASIVWHGQWVEMSPYVAAKGAIVAMTRALARELGRHEIRVNAVAPGAFPTAAERAQHADLSAYEQRILDSQALKRRGRFDELAAVVAFLASDQASFVTGQTVNVDGGWIMV